MTAKKLFIVIISLCLTIIFTSLTAYADGYGDKGYDTTHDDTFMIDNLPVFTYITGSGGTIEQISDSDSVQQYKAVASDHWEFAYWSTYYYGPVSQGSNVEAFAGYYYFSKPGDRDSRYVSTDPVIQINKEGVAAGTYYLQAIFKPKVTVTVNTSIPANALSLRCDSPAAYQDNIFYSSNSNTFLETYVPFGGSATASLSYFTNDYIIESITVHDGAPRTDFTYETIEKDNCLRVYFMVERPTNVHINVKRKTQNVSFDANTGTGTMDTQPFDSSTEKELSKNTFSKTGYLFNGWNTKADGSGTAYTDGQAVTFAPRNDNDTITLYAQWKECTDHKWLNGTCIDCDFVCSHSYSYAVNAENKTQIIESCICDHQETATLEPDTTKSTVYSNGSAIEALMIIYSDSWGGDQTASISYTNNTQAGTASGSLTIDGQTATRNFSITKAAPSPLDAPAVQNTITYGDSLSTALLIDGWLWDDGTTVPPVHNNGYMAYYIPADVRNYDWTTVDGWNETSGRIEITVPVTVSPKELKITWGDTSLIYDGTKKFPAFQVAGIVSGDDVHLTHKGTAVKVGKNYTAEITGISGADAENYKLPSNTKTSFSIIKAKQTTPTANSNNISSSPNTGDHSKLLFWIGLLLISGGCLLTLNARK